MAELKADASPKGCEACHTAKAWKQLSGFDHAATAFPLEEAHRSVACDSCHKNRDLQPGVSSVIFNSAPKVCSSCHEDIHAAQFADTGGAVDCARCHRTFRWRPATFDHETGSTYRLDGSHKNVPCALCHLNSVETSGRSAVMYKPTARECAACHQSVAAEK
jgi:hypothetical protein